LSMNPVYLAENQKVIGEIDVAKAEALAQLLLAMGDVRSVEKELFPS
jgi:hypothetical protein